MIAANGTAILSESAGKGSCAIHTGWGAIALTWDRVWQHQATNTRAPTGIGIEKASKPHHAVGAAASRATPWQRPAPGPTDTGGSRTRRNHP